MSEKAMDTDEWEWVIDEAEEDARFDADWVVTNASRPRAVSGVFFGSAFAPFDACSAVPDPPIPASIPTSARPCCSSGGLLLLRCPWSTFFVGNPATAEWAALPLPPRARARGPVLALVPHAPDFYVVSALEISPGLYSFDVFSSESGRWWPSAAEARVAGRVVPGSGVSAGAAAYWRTASDAVLAYDAASDAARAVAALPGKSARWQLGEAGGRLCCACVAGAAVKVHVLRPDDRWAPLRSFALVEGFEAAPWPLRFQGSDPEAILLSGNKVLGANLNSGRVRELELGGAASTEAPEDFVPHINTIAAQLIPYDGRPSFDKPCTFRLVLRDSYY